MHCATSSRHAPAERHDVEKEDAQIERHEAVVEHGGRGPQAPPIGLYARVLRRDLARQVLQALVCTGREVSVAKVRGCCADAAR